MVLFGEDVAGRRTDRTKFLTESVINYSDVITGKQTVVSFAFVRSKLVLGALLKGFAKSRGVKP